MKRLNMHVEEPYEIVIANNLFHYVNEEIKKVYHHKKIYILTDERVASFYLTKLISSLSDFQCECLVIKGYEKSKSLKTYEFCAKKLLELGLVRNELLLAFGGGVIGDLGGFLAATIYRGIPYIQIPTTLLSQVDSSIGGKTAIDFLGRKNILGAFYQPKLVLVDPLLLETLPKREYQNGLGEVIKTAMIGSFDLVEKLFKESIHVDTIEACLQIKKQVVEEDPFDYGKRMILNFGHTFGHVLELRNQDLLHGEAVMQGMLMAIDFGIEESITNPICKQHLLNLLSKFELNINYPYYKEYLAYMKEDKKNLAGKFHFVFLKEIGEPVIQTYQITE